MGDLGEYINGLAFKPSDWEDQGRRIIRIQNLTNPDRPFNRTRRTVPPQFIIDRGTILVSWSATLDVFVWYGDEAVLNQHIFKVVPTSRIGTSFVKWALKNAIDEMWRGEHTHGTTMRHINRGPFLAHQLLLPPVNEQQRIADALDSLYSRLEAAVASLEHAEAKLKAYRASVLKAAVEGRLVPTEAALARAEQRDYEPAEVLLKRILAERRRGWEEAELAKMKSTGKAPKDDKWKAKYQEPTAPDTKALPQLPEGWCWATIHQLSDVTGGITKNSARETIRTRMPYLRVANVYANILDLEQIKEIGVKPEELPRVRLQRGDLLIVEGNGSPDQIGRVALWDGSISPIVHQNHLIKARFPQQGTERWALLWLLSSGGRELIERVASSTSGLHTLSISKIERLAVPLPPLPELTRISDEIDKISSVSGAELQIIADNAKRCTRLRQAILKWAFEGKLVDQNPNDEPAEKLLDRIRAERVAKAPGKKTARRRKMKAPNER